MNIDKLCFGCFQEKEPGICPHCGFDDTAEQPYLALPLGTIVNGRYMLGKVLGIGGFGITYLAYDLTLEIKVAIKEYMPSGIATRNNDRYTVSLTGQNEMEYRAGEERFLEEARILAKLQNTPNIVSVQNYFRENNTAYFVMEYVEGKSLKEVLAFRGGRIPWQETVRILKPIMEALVHVHAMNLTHRDISPDNIVITPKGESKLLDFGAARFSVEDDKSRSVILKHGYAPAEQYSSHGHQGPWTDVYAMGATLYRCITGQLPPDSVERIREDRIRKPSAEDITLPLTVERVLMKALAVESQNRYQTMEAFIAALEDAISDTDMPEEPGRISIFQKLRKKPWIGGVIAGSVVLILILAVILPSISSSDEPLSASQSSQEESLILEEESSEKEESSREESETSEESEQPVEWLDHDLGILNGTIQIPSHYVESEDWYTYTDSENGRMVEVNYVWNNGVPIYSTTDVSENYEMIIEGVLSEYADMEAYSIVSAELDEINAQTAFLVQVEATLAEGEEENILWAAVEGSNGFGCYTLLGSCAATDAEGAEEIHSIFNSFESSGEVDISFDKYVNEELGFQFIYEAEAVEGSVVVEESTVDDVTLYFLMIYPETDENAAMIEVENAGVYAQTREEALEYNHSMMSSISNVTAGEEYTETFGNISWLIRDYTQDTYSYSYAAAEIDGECFVTAFRADEEYKESTIALWIQIMRSLRSVGGSQAEGLVNWRDATILNIEMGISERFEVSDTSAFYFTAEDGSQLYLDYHCMGWRTPVYSFDMIDPEQFMESYIVLSLPESYPEEPVYRLLDTDAFQVDGREALRLVFEVEKDSETMMNFDFFFIESDNDFGCYLIRFIYPQSSTDMPEEVEKMILSFRCHGLADPEGVRIFSDDVLPYQFMYEESEAPDGFVIESDEDGTYDLMAHPLGYDTATLQIMYYEANGRELETFLDDTMAALPEQLGIGEDDYEVGRFTSPDGGLHWIIRETVVYVNDTDMHIYIAGTEIDDVFYITLLVSEESVFEEAQVLQNHIRNSFRPVS